MLEFPLDIALLLRTRRRIIRQLTEQGGHTSIRLAILGGSTTQEIASWIELFLLDRGLRAEVQHSDYNRYFEDTVLDPSRLVAFAPDVVYLHFDHERSPFFSNSQPNGIGVRSCSECLHGAPSGGVQGHLDAYSFGGGAHFVSRLNYELAREARANSRLLLHDAASLIATSEVTLWFAPERWFAYKIPTSPEADVLFGHSLASLIGAVFGRSRKCLMLDLDNTLWGGVIGDDGPDNIIIGRETPRGEAYTAFQEYCKLLKERGVILAVCSKNDDAMARRGFTHPDSVLKLEDFAAFYANWDSKPDSIRSISEELNVSLDSFVFIDDNPAERFLVSEQLPMVAVPNVGSDVSRFPAILDAGATLRLSRLRARTGSVHSITDADQQQDDRQRASDKDRVTPEPGSGDTEDDRGGEYDYADPKPVNLLSIAFLVRKYHRNSRCVIVVSFGRGLLAPRRFAQIDFVNSRHPAATACTIVRLLGPCSEIGFLAEEGCRCRTWETMMEPTAPRLRECSANIKSR